MAPDKAGTTGSGSTGPARSNSQRAKAHVKRRPASSVGIFTAALCVVAAKLGVDLTAEEAAILVAAASKAAESLADRLLK